MSEAVDVAIVGAGPYGLSVAAHLRAAGVTCRQFGLPMRLWQESMPRGMFLKSQGFASNLSDPAGTHTLEAFCRKTGQPYASYGLPVPLDTFISYGQWFADELVPSLEEVMVTEVARQGDGFAVSLASGEPSGPATSSSPPASSTSPGCPGCWPTCRTPCARTPRRIPT